MVNGFVDLKTNGTFSFTCIIRGFPMKPNFLSKLNIALANSWKSSGSVSCNITEAEENCWQIEFFPAIRELLGGAEDGATMYPGFHFNVGRFAKVFDRKRGVKVSFDCLKQGEPSIMFEGRIGENYLEVSILSAPPETAKATERIYTCGPKSGVIETIR